MTDQQLKEKLGETSGLPVLIAKKKKKGGYTVFPQVVDLLHTTLPIFGECQVLVYEE